MIKYAMLSEQVRLIKINIIQGVKVFRDNAVSIFELESGVMTTQKRRSILSFIFNCLN